MSVTFTLFKVVSDDNTLPIDSRVVRSGDIAAFKLLLVHGQQLSVLLFGPVYYITRRLGLTVFWWARNARKLLAVWTCKN